MKVRQAIAATVLDAFNEERSIYGAFHLLKGKKSAQTIQDGAFFGLLSYFGLFPALTRTELEEDVRQLVQKGQANLLDTDKIALTDQGKAVLKKYHADHSFLTDLEGWRYNSYTEEIWLRFSLFIQTLTNITFAIRQFYPITHQINVQVWVKNHLPLAPDREKVLKNIHNELLDFLSTCMEKQAIIFVNQLSGKNQIGLTRQQLSEELGMSEEEVRVCHVATLHRLIRHLEMDQKSVRYLSVFIKDLKRTVVLTESAQRTFQLLKKGYNIDSICKKRQLKQSTIEDHIVEIAIQDSNFSIRPFVSTDVEKSILELSITLRTSRLRDLKIKMKTEVSYFMIRLVLARKKVNHET